jgi:hypothetical protein
LLCDLSIEGLNVRDIDPCYLASQIFNKNLLCILILEGLPGLLFIPTFLIILNLA